MLRKISRYKEGTLQGKALSVSAHSIYNKEYPNAFDFRKFASLCGIAIQSRQNLRLQKEYT